MKYFLGLILAFTLLSAGCESTSPAASTETNTDAAATAPEKNTEPTEAVRPFTDYSDKEEVGDIKGSFKLNGDFSNAASYTGKYIKLYETEGKNTFILDSAKMKNGSFSINLKEARIGVHKIGFKRSKLGEFIINPNEKDITLSGNVLYLNNTMKVTGSKENEALAEYRRLEKKYNASLKQIKSQKASKEVKLKQIYAEYDKFKTVQEDLANKYSGTFFAKMVRRIQSPNKQDQGKYWSDVDFTDESLIRSPALNERVQEYMRYHGSKGEDGFLNAVDNIYSKASVNEAMANFMLYTMMEGFYSSNMKEEAFYVADNYIHGDGCGDLEVSNLLIEREKGLRSLEIGANPPDFAITDDKGKMVKMSEVAAKNDFTLIVFWASWCHKCEQEMPVLKRVYDKYSSQGFEIIGVSVDENMSAWKKGIQDKQCTWINVSQLEQWESPVAKDYRISSTPVMFLVDSKGELILKPDRAFKLENWMKENF
ncbi:MAG: thioredoxin-like domain-containing protein [Flavobacteriales bacterium]